MSSAASLATGAHRRRMTTSIAGVAAARAASRRSMRRMAAPRYAAWALVAARSCVYIWRIATL